MDYKVRSIVVACVGSEIDSCIFSRLLLLRLLGIDFRPRPVVGWSRLFPLLVISLVEFVGFFVTLRNKKDMESCHEVRAMVKVTLKQSAQVGPSRIRQKTKDKSMPT